MNLLEEKKSTNLFYEILFAHIYILTYILVFSEYRYREILDLKFNKKFHT